VQEAFGQDYLSTSEDKDTMKSDKLIGIRCFKCMIGYLHTPPEFTALYQFGDENDLIKYREAAIPFNFCPFCGKKHED